MGRKAQTPEAKAHRAEAGRRNLEAYWDSIKKDDLRLQKDIVEFTERIRSEVGPDASATRKGLTEQAVALYSSIVLISAQLAKRRPKGVAAIAEKLSRLSGRLTKCLCLLKIDTKPRPRTLADILPPRPTAIPPVSAPKQAESTPSKAESPAS